MVQGVVCHFLFLVVMCACNFRGMGFFSAVVAAKRVSGILWYD